MQRYHSGRTRCQVNQEVASTDAPTPRIDSLQATPKDEAVLMSTEGEARAAALVADKNVEHHSLTGVKIPSLEPRQMC